MNQETEKVFDVYRKVSLCCIYSTRYCTGYCEMDMFQLIWKNKSDLGFKELKKNKWIWCSCKKSHWQEIWGHVLFFCHQKHKNNNNKNHRADGCPLKPINNARFRLVVYHDTALNSWLHTATKMWPNQIEMKFECFLLLLFYIFSAVIFYYYLYSMKKNVHIDWKRRCCWYWKLV